MTGAASRSSPCSSCAFGAENSGGSCQPRRVGAMCQAGRTMMVKHGFARRGHWHALYRTRLSMRERCRNTAAKSWKHYGGSGIAVCARWDDFRSFVSDVGPKPSPRHTLDRIDNNGNYDPSNVRWATPKQQSENQRVGIHDQRGSKNPSAKLTQELAEIIRVVAANCGFSLSQTARYFHVGRTTVHEIANHQRWSQ